MSANTLLLFATLVTALACVSEAQTNTTVTKFALTALDTGMWVPATPTQTAPSLTICASICKAKGSTACGGYAYNSATQVCTLGTVNTAATATGTTTPVYVAG